MARKKPEPRGFGVYLNFVEPHTLSLYPYTSDDGERIPGMTAHFRVTVGQHDDLIDEMLRAVCGYMGLEREEREVIEDLLLLDRPKLKRMAAERVAAEVMSEIKP